MLQFGLVIIRSENNMSDEVLCVRKSKPRSRHNEENTSLKPIIFIYAAAPRHALLSALASLHAAINYPKTICFHCHCFLIIVSYSEITEVESSPVKRTINSVTLFTLNNAIYKYHFNKSIPPYLLSVFNIKRFVLRHILTALNMQFNI